LFQIVFLPYIARGQEIRHFDEPDKMWWLAHELVIFKWRCISLLCVLNTYSTCLKADCEFHDTHIPLAILLREELLISVGCHLLEAMFWGSINPKNDLKI
jgi:hypothetical protein